MVSEFQNSVSVSVLEKIKITVSVLVLIPTFFLWFMNYFKQVLTAEQNYKSFMSSSLKIDFFFCYASGFEKNKFRFFYFCYFHFPQNSGCGSNCGPNTIGFSVISLVLNFLPLEINFQFEIKNLHSRYISLIKGNNAESYPQLGQNKCL